jgi:hypothetical protein
MTAQADYYRAIIIRDAGRVLSHGAIGAATASIALAGSSDAQSEITIPAASDPAVTADLVTVYTYDGHNDWDLFELRVRGDGTLHGWEIWDTPESTTDLTASGDNPRAHYFRLNCNLPRLYPAGRGVLIHPTLATDLGVTSGKPSVMTSPLTGMLDGYLYSIMLFNPDTEADVRVEMIRAK